MTIFIIKPFSKIYDESQRFPLVVNPNEVLVNKLIFEESCIAPQCENREFLLTLFEGKKFTAKLLFRGSRDGFGAAKFHQLCDNKGPTLTLCSWKFSIFFNQKNKT